MTNKVLVETTGPYEYMVPGSPEYIRFDGGTVVSASPFVNSKIASGELKLIENLLDNASDDEYLKYVADCDGNFTLANAAFLSKFGKTSVAATTTTTTPARRGRPPRGAA